MHIRLVGKVVFSIPAYTQFSHVVGLNEVVLNSILKLNTSLSGNKSVWDILTGIDLTRWWEFKYLT